MRHEDLLEKKRKYEERLAKKHADEAKHLAELKKEEQKTKKAKKPANREFLVVEETEESKED